MMVRLTRLVVKVTLAAVVLWAARWALARWIDGPDIRPDPTPWPALGDPPGHPAEPGPASLAEAASPAGEGRPAEEASPAEETSPAEEAAPAAPAGQARKPRPARTTRGKIVATTAASPRRRREENGHTNGVVAADAKEASRVAARTSPKGRRVASARIVAAATEPAPSTAPITQPSTAPTTEPSTAPSPKAGPLPDAAGGGPADG